MTARSIHSGAQELLTMFDHVLEEDGFGWDHWHSLLWNLHNVQDDQWDMRPTRCGRTIREIVHHIGKTWLLYSSCSFRNEPRVWEDLAIDGASPDGSRESTIAWLRKAHRQLRDDIAGLTDADLRQKRPAPWGDIYETRRLIELQIQHTLYHAGEINHLRAQLQGNDDWNHQDMGRKESAA